MALRPRAAHRLQQVEARERAGEAVAPRERGEGRQQAPRLARGGRGAAVGRGRRLRLQQCHAARQAHAAADHRLRHAVPHLEGRVEQACARPGARRRVAAVPARRAACRPQQRGRSTCAHCGPSPVLLLSPVPCWAAASTACHAAGATGAAAAHQCRRCARAAPARAPPRRCSRRRRRAARPCRACRPRPARRRRARAARARAPSAAGGPSRGCGRGGPRARRAPPPGPGAARGRARGSGGGRRRRPPQPAPRPPPCLGQRRRQAQKALYGITRCGLRLIQASQATGCGAPPHAGVRGGGRTLSALSARRTVAERLETG